MDNVNLHGKPDDKPAEDAIHWEQRAKAAWDALDDVVCMLSEAHAITDLLTAVRTEELCENTIQNLGYALSHAIDRMDERLKEVLL